jgi:hypothetical protein
VHGGTEPALQGCRAHHSRGRAPQSIAVHTPETIFVTNAGGRQIRALAPDGTVTAVAGTGGAGPEHGQAAAATLLQPVGLTVDVFGAVVVDDGNRIRRIAPTP